MALAISCRAESLGVSVPRGGPDAISQEDLQRDAWLLMDPALGGRNAGTPGAEEASRRVERRFQEMRTLPAFGTEFRVSAGDGGADDGWIVCGSKDGTSDRAVIVAARDEGTGARSGAVPVAAVVSLAKAFDVPGRPERTVVLCAIPWPGGLEALERRPPVPPASVDELVLVGPVGDGDRVEAEGSPWASRPTRLWSTSEPSPPSDGYESVDYRKVESFVRALYAAVAKK